MLDLAAILLAVATFLGVADPDVLLHGVWVCLIVGAFLFGLRATLVRIAAATVVVFAFAMLADAHAFDMRIELQALWTSEWPLMIVIALIVAVMADRLMTTGRRYAALYRQASDRLLTAQEDERQRLAGDLHDGVGQSLTGLLFTLDAVDSMLSSSGGDPETVRETLHKAQVMGVAALRETREVSRRLRPARLQEAGLAAAIRELAIRAGHPVEVQMDPEAVRPGLLGLDREIEVYRIAQEALGNATRHADAATIWLTLEARRDGLVVRVADDGRGFDADRAGDAGLGLAGMRERAIMLGADLDIRSMPGRGSVVELCVPWSDAPELSPAATAPVASPAG